MTLNVAKPKWWVNHLSLESRWQRKHDVDQGMVRLLNEGERSDELEGPCYLASYLADAQVIRRSDLSQSTI